MNKRQRESIVFQYATVVAIESFDSLYTDRPADG